MTRKTMFQHFFLYTNKENENAWWHGSSHLFTPKCFKLIHRNIFNISNVLNEFHLNTFRMCILYFGQKRSTSRCLEIQGASFTWRKQT